MATRAHFYTLMAGVCALCEADSPDTMNVWAVLRHYVPYKELRTLRRLRVYPSALCSGNSLLAQTISFDFKKEYREFYLPKAKPEIVTVPCANYIAVRGRGDPNEENGAYQRAIGVLYAVAYTLKMSKRAGHEIDSFFDYVVPPLEGFWQMPDTETVAYGRKSDFRWISVLRLPDFVTKADFDWAVEAAAKKKKLDCSKAEFLAVDEGLCVQIMHVGSFDDEPESAAKMDAFLRENGYENDLNDVRLHHEIYLSDPRRVAAEKRKTVLRHPIKKA